MTDGQWLLLILSLIYLSDCYLWLDKHAVLFISWWGRGWRADAASPNLSSASAGPAVLNPLPPFGRFFVGRVLPVSISPGHIAAYNSQTPSRAGRPRQSGQVVAIDEIRRVESRDGALWINGARFCGCHHEAAAETLAQLIQTLSSTPAPERAEAIELHWARRLDAAAVRSEAAELEQKLWLLRDLCSLLFLCAYVVLPILSLRLGVNRVVIPGGLALLAISALVACLYYRLHRSIHPSSRADAIIQSVRMVLCPPIAIRAPDHLWRGAQLGRDPLALANALLPGPAGGEAASAMLRDLRRPLSLEIADPPLEEICAWQNETVLRVASKVIPELAETIRRLDDSPAPEGADQSAYCPRCLEQFSVQSETCPDCVGVRLESFGSARGARKKRSKI